MLLAFVLISTLQPPDDAARTSVKAVPPPRIKVVGDVVSVDASARTVTVRIPGTVTAMNVGDLTTDVAPRTMAAAPAPAAPAAGSAQAARPPVATTTGPALPPAAAAVRPLPATMVLPAGVVAGSVPGVFTITFPDGNDQKGIAAGDRIEIGCQARPSNAGATGTADNPFSDCATIDDVDEIEVTKPATQ